MELNRQMIVVLLKILVEKVKETVTMIHIVLVIWNVGKAMIWMTIVMGILQMALIVAMILIRLQVIPVTIPPIDLQLIFEISSLTIKMIFVKVENILKDNLDSIPSPSTFSENSSYRHKSMLEV